MSITLVPAECNLQNGEIFADLSQEMLDKGLEIAPGYPIIQDKTTQVLLMNRTKKAVKIKKGSKLTINGIPAQVHYLEQEEYEENFISLETIQAKEKPKITYPKLNTKIPKILELKFKELIHSCKDLWSEQISTKPIGTCNIRLLENCEPHIEPTRRRAPDQLKYMQECIKELAEQGFAENASPDTQWVAEPVLVKSKQTHGKYRFCIDYRKLNSATIKHQYPLPRTDDSLNAVANKKIFSVLDIRKAFWNIEIPENQRSLTTFRCNGSLWRWKRMPFGLKNGSSDFQRILDSILGGFRYNICIAYIDDLLIFSNDEKEHMEHLELILNKLNEAGLRINGEKCEFFVKETIFLGHKLTTEGIAPDPTKIAKLKEWELPKTVKQLQSFLGFTNYYGRLVKGYAQLSAPLFKLLNKGQKVPWTDIARDQYNELKKAVINSVGIYHRIDGTPLILDPDASEYAVGVVLSQLVDGQEQPIGFHSRTLSKYQRNWHISRKEAFAIVEGVKKFEHFLMGEHFLVRTDHKFLVNLRNETKEVLKRWALVLEDYSYDIEYRPGPAHGNADGMSRMEKPEQNTEVLFIEQLPEIKRQAIYECLKRDPLWSVIYDHIVNGKALESDDSTTLKKARRLLDKYAITAEIGAAGIIMNKLLYEHTNGIKKPIIPATLVQPILIDIHRTAHLGKARNVEMFKRSFFSELSTDTMKQLLGNCKDCAEYKPKTNRLTGIGNLNSTEPWHTISIDVMHMIESEGYKYVLVIVDHFTRWMEAIPIKQQEIDTILAELKLKFLTFGDPKIIIADNAFYARNLKTYCEAKDIEIHISLPHKHSGNGRVERAIGTIRPLMTIARSKGKSWVAELPTIITEYRNTISAATGYTPQYLMFGRERSDNALTQGMKPLRNETQSQNWLEAMKIRNERIELIARNQQAREHTSTKAPTLNVGDYVIIYNQHRHSKDQPMYDKTYVVDEVDDRKPRVSLKLKPYRRRGATVYRHIDQVKKIDPPAENDTSKEPVCMVIRGPLEKVKGVNPSEMMRGPESIKRGDNLSCLRTDNPDEPVHRTFKRNRMASQDFEPPLKYARHGECVEQNDLIAHEEHPSPKISTRH